MAKRVRLRTVLRKLREEPELCDAIRASLREGLRSYGYELSDGELAELERRHLAEFEEASVRERSKRILEGALRKIREYESAPRDSHDRMDLDDPDWMMHDQPIRRMVELGLARAGVGDGCGHWRWPSDKALTQGCCDEAAGLQVTDCNGAPVDLAPLQFVLIRLCLDLQFCEALKADLRKGVRAYGYRLSGDEFAMLEKVTLANFDNFAAALWDAVSAEQTAAADPGMHALLKRNAAALRAV